MDNRGCEDLVTPGFFTVNEETVSELGLVRSSWCADTESAELRVAVGHIPFKSQLLPKNGNELETLT